MIRSLRRRVIYRCGNCGETFRTVEKLDEHRVPVCPLVVIERQAAAWNARARLRISDTEIAALRAVAEDFERDPGDLIMVKRGTLLALLAAARSRGTTTQQARRSERDPDLDYPDVWRR